MTRSAAAFIGATMVSAITVTALALTACTRTQNSCANPCTVDGGTRCVGDQVETCLVVTSACKQWSAATTCAAGEVCDGTACIDICATPTVVAACAPAATHITSCCGLTLGDVKLCHDALAAGTAQDETALAAACTAQAQATCADLHTSFRAQSLCCCSDGGLCDYQTSAWQCAKKCTSASDCADQGERSACAPNENGTIASAPMLCKAKDGGPYRGCDAAQACSTGACFSDAQSNDYCAATCMVDTDCGDTQQACCILTDSIPAGAGKGCAPCPTGGG